MNHPFLILKPCAERSPTPYYKGFAFFDDSSTENCSKKYSHVAPIPNSMSVDTSFENHYCASPQYKEWSDDSSDDDSDDDSDDNSEDSFSVIVFPYVPKPIIQ